MTTFSICYNHIIARKRVYKGVSPRQVLFRGVMQREVIRLPWFELIRRTLIKEGNFSEAVASEVSWRVLSFFGYSDEIIDNVLDADDRRLFYFLQDLHVLSTHGEEAQLLSGMTWRIFYWNLDRDAMERVIEGRPMSCEKDIYLSLPEGVWSTHDELVGGTNP